jgi:ribonuclease D
VEARAFIHDTDEVTTVPRDDIERVSLIADEEALREAAKRLGRAERVAIDIESNGLFKYRASLCTIQLATNDEIVIVDTIAVSAGVLAPLLGPNGPRKIVHDVAFDARILAETNVELGNVLDTSLAARMLGRTATGLASLLASELGITIDKKLQHHDWSERPLERHHLQYLAADVVHLGALADKLRGHVLASDQDGSSGIEQAIEEETRYRLAQAAVAARTVDPRPPYVRMKGIDRVPKEELPILRRLAEAREAKARSLDVPPYKVLGPDVLFAIAKARPKTHVELARVRGATNGHRARSMASDLLRAVLSGAADGPIPDEDRRLIERPRPPPATVKERRARESRLTAWRKGEAKKRGVDEQVVLPGHCLQDLVDLGAAATVDQIAAVAGLGRFRSARDGAALLALLTTMGAASADAGDAS